MHRSFKSSLLTLLIGATALQPTSAAMAAPAAPASGRENQGVTVGGQLIDKAAKIKAMDFLDNRDTRWYEANIPFIETPDPEIDKTWYYRFDMMTKHFVYGSPEHGYSVTEFIDRPGWSGTYGAISAPLGLQFSDLRWLRDQRITRDYARYWMHVPGAQPRSYTNWFGDSMWGLYEAWGDKNFIISMLPDMKAQYEGWVAEHWDKRYDMPVWDGMHDGMETNINSRQTPDWFTGAPGVRPTLSSYMFADARAISKTAALVGDKETADLYAGKAAALKEGVQRLLWDPKRQFFFHMFANEEKLADNKPGKIDAGTLTYQSGPYAGSPYGRELIGYVPWMFHLPDEGYEVAWAKLMDPKAFAASFGPTTTERNDPLFRVTNHCCEWSGNSWPFATAQTLKAMANVILDYKNAPIEIDDYYKLLSTYSQTQRMDGKPYIAEAAHPDTGRWQIVPGHSEHYFHSSYVDLIVTGLAGLRPRVDDVVEVNPLIPRSWPWFALEDVSYHGHLVTILWDRDGTKYGRGKGLSIFADGKRIGHSSKLGRVTGKLPAVPQLGSYTDAGEVNFAVNNSGEFFPRITPSVNNPDTPAQVLNDGAYWYLKAPGNRWTSEGSSAQKVSLEIDFGIERPVDRISMHLLDDGEGQAVRAPASYTVQYLDGTHWKPVSLKQPVSTAVGRKETDVAFTSPVSARKFKIILEARDGASVGLTELGAWGTPPSLPLPAPTASIDDLAYNPNGEGFPKATSSYTSGFDRIEEINDGKVFFSSNSRNRWTAYESPNEFDWVAIDFGSVKTVGRLEVYWFGDNGGVRSPINAVPQYWTGTEWKSLEVMSAQPLRPRNGAMQTFVVKPVETSQVRLWIAHDNPGKSGITELMIWEK